MLYEWKYHACASTCANLHYRKCRKYLNTFSYWRGLNSCCYKYFRAIDRRTLRYLKIQITRALREGWMKRLLDRVMDVGRPILPWNRRTIYARFPPEDRINSALFPFRLADFGGAAREIRERGGAAAKYFRSFFPFFFSSRPGTSRKCERRRIDLPRVPHARNIAHRSPVAAVVVAHGV